MKKYQYALINDNEGNENLWKFMDNQEFESGSEILIMTFRDNIYDVNFKFDDFEVSAYGNILHGKGEMVMDTNLLLFENDADNEQNEDDRCDASLCDSCIFRNRSFCNAHGMNIEKSTNVSDCYSYADGISMRRQEDMQDDCDDCDVSDCDDCMFCYEIDDDDLLIIR